MELTKSMIEQLNAAVEDRPGAIAARRCINPPIGCGQEITGFNDALSEKEYGISGLCQGCQDEIFKDD